jgi:hypothetical protein
VRQRPTLLTGRTAAVRIRGCRGGGGPTSLQLQFVGLCGLCGAGYTNRLRGSGQLGLHPQPGAGERDEGRPGPCPRRLVVCEEEEESVELRILGLTRRN